MSAGEEVTYIYEPSLEMHINGTVGEYLIDLFQCEISYKKRPWTHKNLETCKISKPRIIKTVREGVISKTSLELTPRNSKIPFLTFFTFSSNCFPPDLSVEIPDPRC